MGLKSLLFGNNPALFHLSNILNHLAVSLIIYLTAKEILSWWFSQKKVKLMASLAGAIFLLHPAQTESVSYISSQDTLLGGLFFFSGLYFILKFLRQTNYFHLILSVILILLATFTRESSLILPLILGLTFVCQPNFRLKILKILPIFTGIVLIFIYYAFIYIPAGTTVGYGQTLLSLEARLNLIQRLANLPLVILAYLKILLLPLGLHMEYHFWLGQLAWSLIILTILAFLGLIVAAIYLSWQRPWLKFFLLWLVLALSPFYQIIKIDATIAERWLYLPMFGFASLMAVILYQIYLKISKTSRPYYYQLIAFLFVLFMIRVIIRNEQWANPLKLYQHDAKLSSNSFVLQNNVGVELFKQKRLAEAGQYFKKALEIEPNYAVARNNYGVSLQNEGKIREAEEEYLLAIKLNNYYLAYANVANIYLKLGQTERAKKIVAEGLKFYPQDQQLNIFDSYLKQEAKH